MKMVTLYSADGGRISVPADSAYHLTKKGWTEAKPKKKPAVAAQETK